jgi:hypothetical protein
MDCQEAVGLEQLAQPIAVRNESALCDCCIPREQAWHQELLNTLASTSVANSHTLTHANFTADS